MAETDLNQLKIKLEDVFRGHLSPDAYAWLRAEAAAAEAGDIRRFNTAFVMMPRKTGKVVAGTADHQTGAFRPGFSVTGWTTDRLCRVWLIMHLNLDPDLYVPTLENLFRNAEMNELVALYSALPVLRYPDLWRKRCAEGIRNNIAQVLESIMCNNPYPSEQLDEPAWNQLVLKAIFTDKPLLKIYRLRERANRTLAESISLFAHERWAAGRQVNPLVWICVVPYVDAAIFPDIERLARSTDSAERKAAALVCNECSYAPAKQLLERNAELEQLITKDNITWPTLEDVLNPA